MTIVPYVTKVGRHQIKCFEENHKNATSLKEHFSKDKVRKDPFLSFYMGPLSSLDLVRPVPRICSCCWYRLVLSWHRCLQLLVFVALV